MTVGLLTIFMFPKLFYFGNGAYTQCKLNFWLIHSSLIQALNCYWKGKMKYVGVVPKVRLYLQDANGI